MYVVNPGAIVQALDATNGDLIWEYKREVPANVASQGRTKSLAIYQDVILYTAPDSYVVGLDARTGKLRWETKADTRGHTSGPIVVDGKVISGGACARQSQQLLHCCARCTDRERSLALLHDARRRRTGRRNLGWSGNRQASGIDVGFAGSVRSRGNSFIGASPIRCRTNDVPA